MRNIAMIGLSVVAAAAVSAASTSVRAQTFPATMSPLYCKRGLMTDGYRDQAGAIDERDIVGTVANPAGFRAVDGQFLYLRMRVDVSPVMGTGLRPFAWGFELSTDGDPANYEILILVDGAAGMVRLYRNTVTTILDSPADPADQPPVMTYPFSTNGQVIDAGPSLFAGANDAFIDVAVPWSDLTPLGLTPLTAISVWAATSTNTDSLNGDFACNDGGGGTAIPSLSQTASAPLTPDPARSPGPVGGAGGGGAPDGGGGGNVIGGAGIEGGPGCNCDASGPARSSLRTGLLGLALLLAGAARRRARCRRAR
jgi:hypothetical protein